MAEHRVNRFTLKRRGNSDAGMWFALAAMFFGLYVMIDLSQKGADVSDSQSNEAKVENRRCGTTGCGLPVRFEVYYDGSYFYSCSPCLGAVIESILVFDEDTTYTVTNLLGDE